MLYQLNTKVSQSPKKLIGCDFPMHIKDSIAIIVTGNKQILRHSNFVPGSFEILSTYFYSFLADIKPVIFTIML